MSRSLLTLVVTCVVLAVPTTAPAFTLLETPSTLPAGATATIRLDAGDAAKTCSIAAKSGRSRAGSFAYRVGAPIVTITWRVPTKARSLRWTVTVRCAASQAKLKRAAPVNVRVKVAGRKRGLKSLIDARSVRFRAGTRADAYSGVAEPSYELGGKGGFDCSSPGIPSVLDANTYCSGYCTWYAFNKRPAENLKGLGHADTWFSRAAARGIPTGKTPRAGAIAWWSKDTYPQVGHVAYVERVEGANVVISEMNMRRNNGGWSKASTSVLPKDGPLPDGYIYGGATDQGGGGGQTTNPGPGQGVVPSTGLNSAPTAISWGPGRIDVFGLGTDGNLWQRIYDPSGWRAWNTVNVGQNFSSTPAVSSWAAGRLDVFARGPAGDLIHAPYDGQGWRPFESLGGQIVGAPSAVSWGPGRIDVFALGADGKLWQRIYDDSTGGWRAWNSLAPGQGFGGPPTVASWAPGRLDVFARGPAGDLIHAVYDAQGWRPFESLGGQIVGAPTAVSWDSGRLDVFALGPDGNLWQRVYDGTWRPWDTINRGQGFSGTPSVASWAPGRLDVFARGPAGDLIHALYDTQGWRPFESLGGVISGGS